MREERGLRAQAADAMPPKNKEPSRIHALAMGQNLSPHCGHSIRSKSTRLTKSGVILNPHFGQVLPSDARTFCPK
jgi:hypothetical protein